jgi:lysophospholipase L1-like esterase
MIFNSSRLLIASLLLTGLIASCNISRKYSEQATKNWEKDILKFEQLDKNEKDPDNAILFVGSSSIRLWSTIKEDVAPFPVIQRGFGGSRFSDLAVFTKRIVYPHQFRALVIFFANDITGGKSDKSPGEVVRLFHKIVSTVRNKYADQPIFLIEITPTQSRWAVWPIVKQLNQMLKKSCNQMHNTYFIETAQAYLNQDSEPRKELFINDMLHQNRKGYEIWGELIKKKLNETLKYTF